jgi:lipopolysaccharide biosynthesis regulator YciM
MSAAMTLALVGLLALLIGLLIGRYYVPDNRQLARTARQADAYARAVNHVLDGQPDAAVAELERIVEEDTDDLEPYFALGALFRSRGEWERAIRVHQVIAQRELKNKQVRRRAFFALGQDFVRAGMPRRATAALEQCLELDSRHERALADLAVLYEEQGRYRDAADTLARLGKLREQPASLREHHLLVAAAQQAMRGPAADLEQTRKLLREARRISERSVHALVARAELAAAEGDPEAASAHLVEALELAPELAAFLLPGLVDTQRQILMLPAFASEEAPDGPSDRERAAAAAAELLEHVIARLGRPDEPFLGLALAEVCSHFDPERALAHYRDLARRFPELLPAQVAAARLALAGGDGDDMREALQRLTAPRGVLAWAMDGAWRCSGCGERRDLFFWRCRTCRTWGSVRLELGRDALVAPPPPPWEEPVPVRGGVHRALSASQRASSLAVSSQAAPLVDTASGAAAASSRSASLWSRVGAWFGGLGGPGANARRDRSASPPATQVAAHAAAMAAPQLPIHEAPAATVDVVPGAGTDAGTMLAMPGAMPATADTAAAPAPSPSSSPSSTPASGPAHDPERTAS